MAEASGEFFAWSADSSTVRPLGPMPGGTTVAVDDRGALWAAVAGQGIGRLHVLDDSTRFESLIDEDGQHLHVAGGRLHYAAGYEVCEVDLAELAAVS